MEALNRENRIYSIGDLHSLYLDGYGLLPLAPQKNAEGWRKSAFIRSERALLLIYFG
jgi:hypothetical protein